MTARNVKNNTETPLGLPSGEVVPAKSTIRVENFDRSEESQVVKTWIKMKAIEISDATESEEEEAEQAPKARIAGTEFDETGNVDPALKEARELTGAGGQPVGSDRTTGTVQAPVGEGETEEADETQDARKAPAKRSKKD